MRAYSFRHFIGLFRKIRWQFVIATVIPLTLITLLLTTYLVSARQKDLREQFVLSSTISTDYLGDKAVVELYGGDIQRLKEMANNIAKFPDLLGVGYFSIDRELVAASANFNISDNVLALLQDDSFIETDRMLHLLRPVYLQEIVVDDYDNQSSPEQLLVGWVAATFDAQANQRQQSTIFLAGVGIALLGLGMAITLSVYLGRSIVQPVQSLTNTVQQLKDGHLAVRAQPSTTEELSSLATGINQMAESVAEGRRNLEKKVRDATSQLEETLEDLRDKNRQLELARELAEIANREKSDFLARMSHELRTPITAIRGFTRLLQDTELGVAERSYTSIINHSSSQLLNLIDDILAISRLQSNAIEIDSVPFNLIEVLEQSVAQMALPAREKGLELVLDIAPEVPINVVGDSFRMSQILINLVSNAVKFTEEGYVRVAVKATSRDEHYSLIHIRVSDTGLGIPTEKQKNLFQAFTQADTSITRKFGGTGLGLAIVKSLLDLMDGTITLESQQGIGTTFLLNVPLPVTAVEKGPSLIDARIALLDLHPLSRQAMSDSLCRYVTELEVVQSIDEISSRQPDALVLGLPSNESTQANCQYLEAILDRCDAPILVLSPSPELSAWIETFTDSANIRTVEKPASQEVMHQSLQQLICKEGAPPKPLRDDQRLLSGIQVLIAEDNPFTREFLKTLLSREGAYCSLVSNGCEAIAACNLQAFDILLIDIHMPEKSGIETVQEIRQQSGLNSKTPIITITADVLQQERLALDNAGITDLLFKPVDEQLLLERILQHCRPGSSVPKLTEKLGDEIPVDTFFKEVNRLLKLIRNACEQEDLEAARDPVHQLLGIAGVFKLPELEVKVTSLHRAVKNHRQSQAVTALEDLEVECQLMATANNK